MHRISSTLDASSRGVAFVSDHNGPTDRLDLGSHPIILLFEILLFMPFGSISDKGWARELNKELRPALASVRLNAKCCGTGTAVGRISTAYYISGGSSPYRPPFSRLRVRSSAHATQNFVRTGREGQFAPYH